MESDLEEGPEEVFNDTIEDVVESMEATEPETEPGGRIAMSSKKVLIHESLNRRICHASLHCHYFSDEYVLKPDTSVVEVL